MLGALVLTLSGIITLLFFMYGYNSFYLLSKARRYNPPSLRGPMRNKPSVAVHLPVYNEKYVARRFLAACASMVEAYGVGHAKLMVLDDSDDDTVGEVDRVVGELKGRGIRVEVLRRGDRRGFKAGALQNALTQTKEKYVAVFDSDFIPPRDFLSKVVPYLEENKDLGIVQTRWGHLNRDFNPLTKAVSIGIDGHFLVEQAGRFEAQCFLNFNGSGGVLRVKALGEAGGWHSDTLAEDLDMSYRVQLCSYRILYLKDLQVPGEVPPTFAAFKRQQGRWARGSLSTARKLLPLVFKDRQLNFRQKIEALLHLTYYLIHPLMLASFLLAAAAAIFNLEAVSIRIPSAALEDVSGIFYTGYALWLTLGAAIVVCWTAVWFCYVSTLREQKMSIVKNLPSLILLGFVGYGISISNTLQAVKAFSGRGGSFMRTPKYAVKDKGDTWRDKKYQIPLSSTSIFEAGGVALGLVSIWYAIGHGDWGIVVILLPYTLAYSLVGAATLLQSVWETGSS